MAQFTMPFFPCPGSFDLYRHISYGQGYNACIKMIQPILEGHYSNLCAFCIVQDTPLMAIEEDITACAYDLPNGDEILPHTWYI